MRILLFSLLLLLLQSCAFYHYKQMDLTKSTATEVVNKNRNRRLYRKTPPYIVVHYTDSISDVSFLLDSITVQNDTITGISRELTEAIPPEELSLKEKYYSIALAFIETHPEKSCDDRKVKLKERWNVEQTHLYISPPESVHIDQPFKISNDHVNRLDIMKMQRRELFIIIPASIPVIYEIVEVIDLLQNPIKIGW